VTRARAVSAGALAAAFLATGAIALGAPGDLTLVSVSSGGAQGAGPVEGSAVSASGRIVAFTSAAALTGAPTGAKVQLYVRDRVAGTTVLASSNEAGQAANGDVDSQDVGNVQFAISGDGRYAVFASVATNLSPGDADAGKDVFRKDLATGQVTLISVNSAGEKANAAVGGDPDVSYTGDAVAFTSGAATNLVPGDANGTLSDVVVRRVLAGETLLAARTTAGVQANGTTERPAISADGHAVAFEAPAGTFNLDPRDAGGRGNDVFVRGLAAGTLAAASDPSAAAGSGFPDIAGDGRFVVMETGERYDPANDPNLLNDVYRRDMGTGAYTLVSARDGSAAAGNAAGTRPAISADAARVAFTSAATDLVTDANAVADVFTRDIAARAPRLASVTGATQGTPPSDRGAIAATGGLAAFVFDDAGAATRLVATDLNLQPDAFATELVPTDATPPGLTLSGPADGASQVASQVPVGGSGSDLSGVASLTINGLPLPLTSSGGFSAALPLAPGANTITVRAVDGAGNASEVVRTVSRVDPPPAAAPARVKALRAGFSRGRLVVRLTLSANARVSIQLLRRRVVSTPRRRVVLSGANRPVIRSLAAGKRLVRLARPTRLRPGGYVVRVRVLSPQRGGAVRTSRVLKVTAPARRR
jgi:Tol biopolymer transport system component